MIGPLHGHSQCHATCVVVIVGNIAVLGVIAGIVLARVVARADVVARVDVTVLAEAILVGFRLGFARLAT